MINRKSECAAIEKINGMYRLIKVSWERDAAKGDFDYYHAAFELDGRWNAEFFDDQGGSVWAHGMEDTLDFEWEYGLTQNNEIELGLGPIASVQVSVADVEYEQVPVGSLCQTVEERSEGIPRHWKKWRII